ncbi:hypothetical protein VNO77_34443 [Canavalia gladiata]|uniref:Uncharacterized protein n=1 Tax=Canavalia gladiata TaxID=3824 RepID=A0AAN9PYJ2_CANGL
MLYHAYQLTTRILRTDYLLTLVSLPKVLVFPGGQQSWELSLPLTRDLIESSMDCEHMEKKFLINLMHS